LAAKVIPFPQKSEINLTEIEWLIRKWLIEMSENCDLIEHVTERMMSFIDKYTNKWFEPTFNLAVPPHFTQEEASALLVSIEEGVDNTASQVHEMINRIIVERFFLEIEIYESLKKAEKQHCLELKNQ
jgi:hypothetical protein